MNYFRMWIDLLFLLLFVLVVCDSYVLSSIEKKLDKCECLEKQK